MLLDSTENKQRILTEALIIAHNQGFSQETLLLACNNIRIDTKYLDLIFPNGIEDLLKFMQEQQMLTLNKIANENLLFHNLKISEKISFLLEQYFSFQINQPIIVKNIWQYFSKNLNLNKQNINKKILLISILSNIADSFWKIIKDQSTDLNYYSKRATLCLIIIKIAKVFAGETSNTDNTKKEIIKQISNIVLFAKYKYRTRQQINNISQILQNTVKEVVFDENNQLKSPKEIIKNLPFIRLIKL
jgi:ubiquinone biosynthesis protein COQ9